MIDLKEILVKHQKWLNAEFDGERADLYGANLHGANLCGADLYGANLRGADLHGANLCGANLHGANLHGANLRDADLHGANLCDANLCGANLCGADLYGADLHGANLCDANLCGANLCGANLCDANLRDANLHGAENVPFIPMACPEQGSYTAFKKCNGYIVVLTIPKDAKRSSATSRKCRASKAKVIRIETLDGDVTNLKSVPSSWDHEFIYTVGKTVKVNNFNDDRWIECAPGIHHFINRQEAVDY